MNEALDAYVTTGEAVDRFSLREGWEMTQRCVVPDGHLAGWASANQLYCTHCDKPVWVMMIELLREGRTVRMSYYASRERYRIKEQAL